MTAAALHGSPRARRALVPSAVLGALIFVGVETMFFSGVMSALTISRAGAATGTWPPPGQPSLAAQPWLAQTVLLLASGALLLLAARQAARGAASARLALAASWALGGAFLAIQARGVADLAAHGLTLTASRQAGFFFLLVGLHGAHAFLTLAVMGVAWWRLSRGAAPRGLLGALQVFWTFAVLMWPILHARVYG